MKTAVVAATKNGAKLARTIGGALGGDVFAKAGRAADGASGAKEYDSLRILIDRIYKQYDGLIFVMAAGIVVRTIAPHIRDKRTDPAIVVIDEKGKYAISLLSGHIGGANALAARVAETIGAQPVVTTATDVNGKVSADLAAARLGLSIEPFERLKYINAEIAEGNRVDFFIDSALENAAYCLETLRAMQIDAVVVDLTEQHLFVRPAVCVTRRTIPLTDARVLLLKPRGIFVGVGCRRGAAKDEILGAIAKTCADIGCLPSDVRGLASVDIKKDETGLLAAAEELGAPIAFYEKEKLRTAIETYGLGVSEFVLTKIGVGNVCEAAALLSSQSKKIASPKKIYRHVTTAAAWEK